ncbi:unnamed protein product [Trichogramma brassicae]|uniref:Uncharacterized protein n=1 Tax=Trichogramma brassicae TaxID=86971 RepID=A0A6H5HZG3_9HYME|nr:unnamed protein product [Trichogramma brassicae]
MLTARRSQRLPRLQQEDPIKNVINKDYMKACLTQNGFRACGLQIRGESRLLLACMMTKMGMIKPNGHPNEDAIRSTFGKHIDQVNKALKVCRVQENQNYKQNNKQNNIRK